MAGISATNSTTASTQTLLNQTLLLQARQAASQAQQQAQQYRSEADQAEHESEKWQQQAEYLSNQLLQVQQAPAPNNSTTYNATLTPAKPAGTVINLTA